MLRRPSHDSTLPPVVIQVFGLVIVTAITAYAIVAKSSEILLAVLALAGGAVGIGGYFEKARRHVEDAITPRKPDGEP